MFRTEWPLADTSDTKQRLCAKSRSICPKLCICPKCHHEAGLNLKNDVPAIRDLDLFGQPSFWTYRPPMHQCPACRQRTQVPVSWKRPHVTYTLRFGPSNCRSCHRCLSRCRTPFVARALSRIGPICRLALAPWRLDQVAGRVNGPDPPTPLSILKMRCPCIASGSVPAGRLRSSNVLHSNRSNAG